MPIVTFEEAFQAAKSSARMQRKNVYTGYQAMTKLMGRFHIDLILPELIRGLLPDR